MINHLLDGLLNILFIINSEINVLFIILKLIDKHTVLNYSDCVGMEIEVGIIILDAQSNKMVNYNLHLVVVVVD